MSESIETSAQLLGASPSEDGSLESARTPSQAARQRIRSCVALSS